MSDSTLNSLVKDTAPDETQEWLESLSSVVEETGSERAAFLLQQILSKAAQLGIQTQAGFNTAYLNTLPVSKEATLPAEGPEVERLRHIIAWNAIAMVLRAGKVDGSLGGHLSTFASAAILYEIGFHYFFKGRTQDRHEDLLFIQGHSSPGIYARSFVQGRFTEEQLDHFRREIDGKGISSYPHPWNMPDYWQFPTVSMGLGPLQAIYQAQFLKYLHNRKLANTAQRKVWAFLGDGEMDEVDSIGALTVASRELLDNLIFVVNCNLQRLDGPVRGNGKIIQELESLFLGAGWNVIKVIWGAGWDELLEKDTSGLLIQRMNECVDGEYQNFRAKDGAYLRQHFFGKYPELLELVKDMTDDALWNLKRGGLDSQKVYAAYAAATQHTGQPTVILAKTVKGYGLGNGKGESGNIAHNKKKMDNDELAAFVKRFNLPISEKEIDKLPYLTLAPDSPEFKFLQERLKAAGGDLPKRYSDSPKLEATPLAAFESILKGSEGREMSTTMAFVRVLTVLLKDPNIKAHIVPIVADESRTFGMEGLFRQLGIYSVRGQLYEPEDKSQLMYYREATDGQLLQQGLNEAGAFSSWMAAGTSYSVSGVPMIPFYIYYSMFGFQRIGDLAWAAGDSRCKGFLLGSLSGRTSLAGEGLQHQDGHNLILANTVPTCISYDPTFAYEMAVIIQDGVRRMYQNQEDVYYYITMANENYEHPAMPEGAETGIIKGMYLFATPKNKTAKQAVQLLGSGAILREVIAAAELLGEYDVAATIWSVPSFNEITRQAQNVDRHNYLHPGDTKKSYVTECLAMHAGPVIAATDYMKVHADQIRAYVPHPYYVLGTDGFGCSDTRARLREYFAVDAKHIAYMALTALHTEGKVALEDLKKAMKTLGIKAEAKDPMR